MRLDQISKLPVLHQFIFYSVIRFARPVPDQVSGLPCPRQLDDKIWNVEQVSVRQLEGFQVKFRGQSQTVRKQLPTERLRLLQLLNVFSHDLSRGTAFRACLGLRCESFNMSVMFGK